MKKKKSTEILLDPADYWEMKLNINFETEFIRYKRLCTKLTKKESRKIDGIYYLTYSGWEEKMINTISSLDHSELFEYIHFLNSLARKNDTIVNLTSTFLFPFFIGLFCPLIFDCLAKLIAVYNIASIIVAAFAFIYWRHYLRKILFNSRDDSLRSSFYTDIMHIAKNHFEAPQK